MLVPYVRNVPALACPCVGQKPHQVPGEASVVVLLAGVMRLIQPYHPSDFHVAQSGGGAMRRCRQKRRRRRPRVNREIRLRATLLRCVPAVFFQQGFGSTGQPPLLGRETLPSLKRRPELPCEMK